MASTWIKGMPVDKIDLNQVHIWLSSLEFHLEQLETFKGYLSQDEISRAKKYHFEKDRRRFIAGRGILRHILAEYLQTDPSRIQLSYSSFGKPQIRPGIVGNALNFNLSHSGHTAIFAFARGIDLGIDIEQLRFDLDVDQISKKFYCRSEIDSLQALEKRPRIELFYKYWTRKEALLKASGQGLAIPMDQVDVTAINEKTFSAVRISNKDHELSTWYIKDIKTGFEEKSAIALNKPGYSVNFYRYSI